MDGGESPRLISVIQGDWQPDKMFIFHDTVQPGRGFQLSESTFNGYLPGGGGRYIDFVAAVTDESSAVVTQRSVVCQPPEKGMGVQ